MFVFGEIQEPLTETVNLVENIIRSQLVELVRLLVHPCIQLLTPGFRLSRLVHWQTEGMRGIYLLRISYSLYGTTEPRLIDCGPTSRGRRLGSMLRTLMRTEALESR
jgi:hypothetical protein